MIKIRVSIVVYRDISDVKRFEIHPFTEDITECSKFLASIEAVGGGDFPEDLCGGLNKALLQKWESSTQYSILITDAPCHGK
jgi:hypothetical protein